MKDLRIGSIRIDSFYILLIIATAALIFIVPDKAYDLRVLLTVFVGFCIADTYVNHLEDSSDEANKKELNNDK